MIAAGRWPGPWRAAGEDEEVTYPEEGCNIGPPNDEREETCGRCGRPIDVCIADPCEYFQEGLDGGGRPG